MFNATVVQLHCSTEYLLRPVYLYRLQDSKDIADCKAVKYVLLLLSPYYDPRTTMK